MQLKDILKGKLHGTFIKGVLTLHDNVPAHCTCTCNPEEPGLPGIPVSWSPTLFSRTGSVGLPPVPGLKKTVESSPFFFRRWGHCRRWDLYGPTKIIFFSGFQTLENRAKKCIKLRGNYFLINFEFFAVAFFLSWSGQGVIGTSSYNILKFVVLFQNNFISVEYVPK